LCNKFPNTICMHELWAWTLALLLVPTSSHTLPQKLSFWILLSVTLEYYFFLGKDMMKIGFTFLALWHQKLNLRVCIFSHTYPILGESCWWCWLENKMTRLKLDFCALSTLHHQHNYELKMLSALCLSLDMLIKRVNWI
jgi:hypothetical protein